MGMEFKCVYNLYDQSLLLFNPNQKATEEDYLPLKDLNDDVLPKKIGDKEAGQLREDVELIEGVYGPFDKEPYLQGKVAPVFFGSAINNFGVKELMDTFLQISPLPLERKVTTRVVEPTEPKFSGFIFKIHAN